MIKPALTVLVALVIASFFQSPRQDSRVELDHVFIVVSPGASAEIEALQSAGLTVGSRVTQHPGLGTASRSVLFENAYLELIWVDSSVPVDSKHVSQSRWFRDAAAWKTTGHSPFGLGLRRLPGDTAALPVPVKRETAPWLDPGTAYELLRRPKESAATEFFVVPVTRSVPDWIAMVRERAPELLKHPGGGQKITGLRVHGPRAQQPRAFSVLRPSPVEMVRSPETLLEIELDDGLHLQRTDLRPTLPLVILR